jgi:transcriptional regulator with XRE-family HTH domain
MARNIRRMKLKEFRIQKGLTQEQLEEISGIDQVHISSLETGKIKNPSWSVVSRLAKALDVSPEELFPVNNTAA